MLISGIRPSRLGGSIAKTLIGATAGMIPPDGDAGVCGGPVRCAAAADPTAVSVGVAVVAATVEATGAFTLNALRSAAERIPFSFRSEERRSRGSVAGAAERPLTSLAVTTP